MAKSFFGVDIAAAATATAKAPKRTRKRRSTTKQKIMGMRMRLAKLEKQQAREEMRREMAKGPRPEFKRILRSTAWETMLARFPPGAWLARVDIEALNPEYSINTVSAKLGFDGMGRGLLERTIDPDWPAPDRKGIGRPWRFLYRLTAEGEAERERLLCEAASGFAGDAEKETAD